MAAPVLRVEGLTLALRGGAELVSDLSFTLEAGQTLALAGESGSGKSLTALSLIGLLPGAVERRAGRIWLGKRDLAAEPEAALRRLRGDRVAMIFQEPMTCLNPVLTVGTQLTEAIRAHRPVTAREARTEAMAALDAVRLTDPARRLAQFPHELSGGMRQRVMIAMALALRPEVLIADEPTTALDVTVQREVLDLLAELRRATGTALLLITHDMGVVAETADRVAVLRQGRLVEAGATADLLLRPQAAYTRDLLAAVPRLGSGRKGGAVTAPEVPPVARLTDVSVRFDLRRSAFGRVTHRVHAVEGVNLTIRPGETFALVGESGSGKSTLARALVGLVPHQGRIEIAGLPEGAGPKARARAVQMVFQDPAAALDPRCTVGSLLTEPLVIHGIGTRDSRRARAEALLAQVGLPPEAIDRYPHEFSGGQRQRLCIARALALEPALIVADECVSALDVSVQARVLDLLRQVQAETGVALLFISHDMAVVESLADRIAVLHMGHVVETGPAEAVLNRPGHPYTQRLLAAVPQPDPRLPRRALPPAAPARNPVQPMGTRVQPSRWRDLGQGHLVAEPA